MSYYGFDYTQKQRDRCNNADTFESRETRMLRIQALLAIIASMLVFLGAFGSFRRRCGNRALALVAFVAYNLSPAIIAYTLGLIQSAPFCSWHFPVWAAYLVVVLGSADSYTAHSTDDIEQWKSFVLGSAATCFMTSWMIGSYVTQSMTIWWAMLLFVILFVKVDERARALMLASSSVMQKRYKLIADYMRTEHDHSDGNPATMCGYRYLLRLEEEAKVHSLCFPAIWRPKKSQWQKGKAPDYRQELKGKVFTVEDVWHCDMGLLSATGDPKGRLKDLCLSFSLFKFICMRFGGYSLPQEAHDKLWRLIQHMLLKENGHERLFRVIEVELAFLFDLLYTKYPVNLNPCRSFGRLLLLLIVVAAPLTTSYFQKRQHSYRMELAICFRNHCDILAVFVTNLLMMSIIVIQIAHFGIMISSEWAKVTYICKYVQNKWWKKNRFAGKLIEIVCQIWLRKPWERRLRQYSLLEACSHSPYKCIYNRFTSAYLDPERDGQKQIAPTNLSKKVTEAIALSLGKNCSRNLERGQASLRLNGMSNELSWACNLETATHVIMVWHIATTFCEHEKSGPRLSQEQRDNFDIATKLSKYLAYLVAFAPRLLPGHPCNSEYIFSCAVSEARELFGGSSVSISNRIQKLKNIDSEQWQETIIHRGAMLGRQLVEVQVDVWKVLADFWAEMMLYVAPSNDTVAHAKYLTMGGEFVTHVWVLVSHAGFTRNPHSGEQHEDPEGN